MHSILSFSARSRSVSLSGIAFALNAKALNVTDSVRLVPFDSTVQPDPGELKLVLNYDIYVPSLSRALKKTLNSFCENFQ